VFDRPSQAHHKGLNLFSRQVVGWSRAGRCSRASIAELVLNALLKAVWRRRPFEEVQGSQFTGYD